MLERNSESELLLLLILRGILRRSFEVSLVLVNSESELLLLLIACNGDEPKIQEVVAHGIGVAATFGGSIFKPMVGEAVSALNANICDPIALHRDYVMAHDASVIDLGQICLFHEDKINVSEIKGRTS